jgi:hypothetical protein
MLQEILHVRQIAGEPRRRWFWSADFDLIVWYDDQDRPAGFQLCYGKGEPRTKKALTWNAPANYSHMAVDDGESRSFRYKATPILVPDGAFDARHVSDAFIRESAEMPSDIVSLVLAKLRQHPESESSRS